MAISSDIRDLVRNLNADPFCKSWDKLLQVPDELLEKTAIHLLKNDPDPEVRSGAVLAVRWGHLGSALDLLVQALKDPSPKVRAKAADSIGKLYDDDGYQPVFEALHDPEPEVRAAARLRRLLEY